jgi:hypothetical protein
VDADDRTLPMDSDEPAGQLDALARVFANQLLACLDECARGRRGLFADVSLTEEDQQNRAWSEAARLRELAVALQAILNQDGERNALCDEFLDLCSMHGESHPGEPRLARTFLARIEGCEVGTPTELEKKPWS